jgi:hypothetical protein
MEEASVDIEIFVEQEWQVARAYKGVSGGAHGTRKETGL